MKMKNKRKKLCVYYKIGILVGLFLLLFPVIAQLSVNIISPFSNNTISNDWIGFLGSYFGAITGGAVTIFGVYLALVHERKISKDNLASNYNNMVLTARPYLFIDPQINVIYPYNSPDIESDKIDVIKFNEGGLCLFLKVILNLSNDGKSSLYKCRITHQIRPFRETKLTSPVPSEVRYCQLPSRLISGEANKSDEISFIIDFPYYSAYGFILEVDFVYYDLHETVYKNRHYYRVAIANLKNSTEPKVLVFLDSSDDEKIIFSKA